MFKNYGKLFPAVFAISILLVNHFWGINFGLVQSDLVVIITAIGGGFFTWFNKAYK